MSRKSRALLPRPRRYAVLLVCGLIATQVFGPTPSYGWNASGHMLVALIAYEQLDNATRDKIVETIKKHPRFNDDFLEHMPLKIQQASEATQDKWIFVHAATWPDIARGISPRSERDKYHHSTWHYINLPYYLTPDDQEALQDDLPINVTLDWEPGMPDDKLNVVQAIQMCETMLSDRLTSPSDRAVYYCWLLHLIGDLHQPLHSTALFSRNRFPKGDLGGNAIPLTDESSLHKFWDSAAGESQSLSILERKVDRLNRDIGAFRLGKRAERSRDPRVWMHESHSHAVRYGYDETILERVAAAEADPSEDLPAMRLPSDYFETAQSVARDRVVEGGFRLAASLKAVSNPQ